MMNLFKKNGLKDQHKVCITREELYEAEKSIRYMKHLDRYLNIRQYCYGTVVDAGCGTGYGSYLIAANPDVEKVHGIDTDKQSIDIAVYEYADKKIEFTCTDILNFNKEVDVLTSIETLEHLKRPEDLSLLATRCCAKEVIISYSINKNTHFNEAYVHDFVRQDILDLFNDYRLTHSFPVTFETEVLIFSRDLSYGKVTPAKRWR